MEELHTRKTEANESNEKFRATLGFDFVFSLNEMGELHCWCIEINGEETGIHGAQDIPDAQLSKNQKAFLAVRMHTNEGVSRKYHLANGIIRDYSAGDFDAISKEDLVKYIKKSLRTVKNFKHANTNPEEVEALESDKGRLHEVVPRENLPREFHKGDTPVSSTGAWILKPLNGRGGQGILVMSSENLSAFVADGTYDEILQTNFLVQELLDDYHIQMDGRRRSMRYLVDFRYMEDGSIQKDFAFGYNRVSPRSYKDPPGKDKVIVSKNYGASSEAATKKELALAQETADAIIHNIAKRVSSPN